MRNLIAGFILGMAVSAGATVIKYRGQAFGDSLIWSGVFYFLPGEKIGVSLDHPDTCPSGYLCSATVDVRAYKE